MKIDSHAKHLTNFENSVNMWFVLSKHYFKGSLGGGKPRAIRFAPGKIYPWQKHADIFLGKFGPHKLAQTLKVVGVVIGDPLTFLMP